MGPNLSKFMGQNFFPKYLVRSPKTWFFCRLLKMGETGVAMDFHHASYQSLSASGDLYFLLSLQSMVPITSTDTCMVSNRK